MGLTAFGPDEVWPRHQKQHWRVAMGLAREAGWTFHHLGAPHRFGILVCPAGEHAVPVDSTARGAETKAKEVPKRLRQCQHGRRSTPDSGASRRRTECERLLARAEELLGRVAVEVGLAEAFVAALADLDAADMMLGSAEANLDEVLALHEEAIARASELEGAPEPRRIAETLSDAEDVVDEAAAAAAKIRPAAVAVPLRARLERARSRAAQLRQDLARL